MIIIKSKIFQSKKSQKRLLINTIYNSNFFLLPWYVRQQKKNFHPERTHHQRHRPVQSNRKPLLKILKNKNEIVK